MEFLLHNKKLHLKQKQKSSLHFLQLKRLRLLKILKTNLKSNFKSNKNLKKNLKIKLKMNKQMEIICNSNKKIKFNKK